MGEAMGWGQVDGSGNQGLEGDGARCEAAQPTSRCTKLRQPDPEETELTTEARKFSSLSGSQRQQRNQVLHHTELTTQRRALNEAPGRPLRTCRDIVNATTGKVLAAIIV